MSDEPWLEDVARAIDPTLWVLIDKYRDDDDWNGTTALVARDDSFKRARAAVAAYKRWAKAT